MADAMQIISPQAKLKANNKRDFCIDYRIG